MLTDAALLGRYAGTRDDAAFRELVHRHVDAVFSAAVRRVGGDRQLAEDVTQRVFVELARQSRVLQRHPVLSAWLHLTTRNQAAAVVRAERRRKRREAEAETMRRLTDDPAPPDWSRLAPSIDAAIDQLGETDRRAVLLRFMDRKSFAEIGETLRVSEDAARMRVDRALDKLRAGLARRGIESTAAALGLALSAQAVGAAPAGLAASVTAAVQGTAAISTFLAALQLMSSAKAMTGAAAAVLVFASAGLAVREHDVRRGWISQVGPAETELAAEQARLDGAKRNATLIESSLAQGPAKAAAATASADRRGGDVSRVPALAAGWDPKAEGDAFMKRHPEVRRELLAFMDGNTDFQFADLYRRLSLTPDQIQRFRELMRSHGGLSRNLDPDGNNLVTLAAPPREAASEWTAAMKALLGDEGMQLFTQISRDTAVRRTVAGFASTLAFSDEPLTAEQSAHLTAALSTARVSPTPGRRGPQSYQWDQVIAASQGVLTPSQIAALDVMRAQEAYEKGYSQKAAEMVEAIYASGKKEAKP